jgi:hypothetical protein
MMMLMQQPANDCSVDLFRHHVHTHTRPDQRALLADNVRSLNSTVRFLGVVAREA